MDVVFDHTLDLELVGQLPNGAKTEEQIKMADIVGIIALKGITLGSRSKEKDAYDIYSLVAYYKRGPETVAKEIRPHLKSGLVKGGIKEIKKEFGSREASGPAWVADFAGEEGEARERRITDAYIQIKRFVEKLKEV